MDALAKGLILIGVVLVMVGLLLLAAQKLPFLGRLPGDILVKREHFTFFLPLATSIVISVIISLILWVIGKFR
jgi:hypothetical protein